MKGRIGNIVIAGTLLLFTLAFLLLGRFYWHYRPTVIMFPELAGTLTIITAAWLLIRSCLVPVTVLAEEGEPISPGDNPRAGLGRRLAWLAGVFPLVYVFGILIGLLLFGLAYTTYHRLSWIQRLIVLAVIFGFVYVGFYLLLGVPLPIRPLWMRF